MSTIFASPSRLAAWIVTLAMMAVLLGSAAPPRAKIDAPAPDFVLTDHTGKQHRLSDYAGRIVVLEWTDPMCPFVDRHYGDGRMVAVYRAARRLEKGVVWLTINSTPGATVDQNAKWVRRHRIPFPVLLDDDGLVARVYDARMTPQACVIDAKGVLRYRGAVDDNAKGNIPADRVTSYILDAVRRIAADKPVPKGTRRAYGCAIKSAR